ncbi:MAG: mycothiol synthase [Propionibacteriales bacterium]|nr:mycothiol synthase [Propionibacteriales bacterium]
MPADDLLTAATALSAIEEVRRACLEHDGADPLDEAAHLRLKHRGLDDLGAWVTGDGFALRRGDELDLAVAPPARGRGLGRRLAALACAAPGPLAAWSHGNHPAAGALAAPLGFARARELWVMRRPAAVPLGAAEPPSGVAIRHYVAADAAAFLAVNAAAFALHPEQGGLDADGLEERMSEPWFDPAGLLLAIGERDQILGFHWTKQHDAATGEVYVVGVAPQAQGRGLGRVLTLAGLHHLAAGGVDEVLLYVESDNAPARQMYASIGFTHAPEDTHVQYRRAHVLEHAP